MEDTANLTFHEEEQLRGEYMDELISRAPDPMNGLSAVPGVAMPQPQGQYKWDRPPMFSDPNDAIDSIIDEFEKPHVKSSLLKFLLAGVSIEEIVNLTIVNGFSEGKINPDVGELIKPALTVKLLNMAQEENVPIRMFVDDFENKEVQDEEVFRVMKQRNPETFKQISENLNQVVRMGEQIEEAGMRNITPEKPAPQGFLGMGE